VNPGYKPSPAFLVALLALAIGATIYLTPTPAPTRRFEPDKSAACWTECVLAATRSPGETGWNSMLCAKLRECGKWVSP
jgi:hypothetical protein